VSAFEAKLERQAQERMARIRTAADPLMRIPEVPDAIGELHDDGGFVPPHEAARRMGIPTAGVLRLAERGVLSVRGSGYGLRVRPALLSGAIETRRDARQVRAAATRDRELSSRDRALSEPDRPRAGLLDDD
jgi:hypothetical protein